MNCSFICEKLIDPTKNKNAFACGHSMCDSCEELYITVANKNEFESYLCPLLDCKEEIFQRCDKNCGKICRKTKSNPIINNICEGCLQLK